MAAPQFVFFYAIALLFTAEHPDAVFWIVTVYATAVARSVWMSRWF